MNWFLKFSILTLLVIHLNAAVYVIPSAIVPQTGGSYTAMLVDEDEIIKPRLCYLTNITDYYKHITYKIDLTTFGVPIIPNNTRIVIPPIGNDTNIITSLGNGICGFKLDKFDWNNSVRKWKISFKDENENYYFKTVDVVGKDIKFENKTQYVKIGFNFGVQCERGGNKWDIYSCKLYDPLGALVKSSKSSQAKCNYRVDISKLSDFGQWKCVLQLENEMSQRKIYHNIIKEEKETINLWTNETNTHVNIGCSISNTDEGSKYNYCEMIRPDGEIFIVKEGLATDRYTALGTNVSKAICNLEIKKPLEECEKGLWRCAYTDTLDHIGGGFINISKDLSTLPPPQPQIPKQIVTLENEDFSGICQVPYSSSYCYLLDANETIYPVKNKKEPTLGICKFTLTRATMADNGTWYCGFSKKTGQTDDLYKFDVIVRKNYYNVKAEKEVVEIPAGSKANLKCSTKGLGDYPIQYCRFQNNRGQIYNINPEEISPGMNYYGRGLEYGDCGIELNEVYSSDAGLWTCITRIGNSYYNRNPELYTKIKLQISRVAIPVLDQLQIY